MIKILNKIQKLHLKVSNFETFELCKLSFKIIKL